MIEVASPSPKPNPGVLTPQTWIRLEGHPGYDVSRAGMPCGFGARTDGRSEASGVRAGFDPPAGACSRSFLDDREGIVAEIERDPTYIDGPIEGVVIRPLKFFNDK